MKKFILNLLVAVLMFPMFSTQIKAVEYNLHVSTPTEIKALFNQYGYFAEQADVDWWSQNKENSFGDLEYNLARRKKLDDTPTTLQSDYLGASIPQVVALFESSLQAKITSSVTSFNLVDGTDKAGNALSGNYGFIINEGASNEEFVSCQCTGTACTACLRGVSPVTGNTEVASLKQEHRRGESVKLTDFPLLGVMRRVLNGDEGLPNTLYYDVDNTATASSTALASRGYIDGVAIGGGVDASSSAKGITKLSVDPVSPTNPIAVGQNDPKVSPVDLTSLTDGQIDALAGTSGTPSSTNKFVTNDDTATSGADKVLRLDGTGKLPVLDGSALTSVPNTNGLITKSFIAGENLTAGKVVIAIYQNGTLQAQWAGANNTNQSIDGGSAVWKAQTFLTSANAVGIRKITFTTGSSDTGPSTITVSIHATSAGSPTGAALGSATVQSNTNTENTVDFITPIAVSPNTTYALVIRDANAGTWGSTAAGGYADGSTYTSADGGGTWSPVATVDCLFKIYETTTNTAVLYLAQDTANNIYANAIIGFAAETKNLGETTKVNLLVDNNQTALIPGTIYYLRTNGGIATTAGTVSRKIGVAISATEILVRHDNP